MLLKDRIEAFVKLNHYLKEVINGNDSDDIIERSINYNNRFTPTNVKKSIQGIINFTSEESLINWISNYSISDTPTGRRVGIVMAGNIPMVGFHDMLSVVISGNIALIKPATDDKFLMLHLIQKLIELEPQMVTLIEVSERLNAAQAMIATGSNNSSRYF